MFEKSVGPISAIAALTLIACGSVAGGDPSFWQPAQGFAGAQAGLIPNPNAGTGGLVGSPSPTGTNGNPFPPPPTGAGGYPNYGGAPQFGGAPNPGGGTPSYGGAPPPATGGDPGGGGFVGGTGGTQPFPGSGGSPNPPPPTGPGSACNFTFDVTTTTYGGHFSPKNVGAIYIENSGGTFVKSLNVWGGQRLGNLTDWEQASGGNTVDAVTSATRNSAGLVSGKWNCTDTNRQPVANGQYQVCCSFQEDDALPFFGPAPKKACVPFTTGAGPFTQNPPNQGNFTSMQLQMQ